MKKIIIPVLFFIFSLFLNIGSVFAYHIEDLQGTPVEDDFVLGPGKRELALNPGEKTIETLIITNRTGEERIFTIEIEDFEGSDDIEKTVVLLGGEKGPYSLKDYLKPELMEFNLQHGQRMSLPVEITIPENIKAGGLYGTVLVSTTAVDENIEDNTGQTKLISRLGTLFFIRIKGNVIESGFLEKFSTVDSKKIYYDENNIPFELFIKNEGNVHISPYGEIKIENLLGKKVGEIPVDVFFALPDSLRKREIIWEKGTLFGRYKATLELNRNYQTQDDVIDEKTIIFWVIPLKIILIILTVIVLLVIVLRFILGKFKFEVKKKA